MRGSKLLRKRCLRTAAALFLAITILYFVAGATLLRFYVENYLIVTGTLPASVFPGEPVSFPLVRGRSLSARVLGKGTNGCVAIFPGRHGPSSGYEAALIPRLIERDLKVYLVAYPGQLRDEPTASLQEVRVLADLAMSQIALECSPHKVVIVGRSLGSMVAAYTSRTGHAVGLLLESASPRLSSAIRAHFRSHWYLEPMLLLPVERLLPEDYNLKFALDEHNVPETVIFQGIRDEQTPIRDLLQPGLLPAMARLIPVPDATHSNVFSLALPQYVETISEMLKREAPLQAPLAIER